MDSKLIIEIREQLEQIFLSRLDADKTQGDFWTDTIKAFESVKNKYTGTAAETFTLEFATFYLIQLRELAKAKAA